MPLNRRVALKVMAAAGATAALPKRAWARPPKESADDAVALLYDPTLCVGCRDCIRACAETNNGDEAVATLDDARVTPLSLTVLRRYETETTETFHKIQCMHCVDPACVSACMLGAMYKGDDGAVRWNGDLCVGCRYCQIGCPFTLPRFEWDTPLPQIAKCQLCPERRAEGLEPACVEKCVRGALVFGTRRDLLAEAHRRIEAEPDRYNPKVYGEHDLGGTSALYLGKAGIEFSSLGLPENGTQSVPQQPETIQHAIYKGFIAPIALLGVFGAVVRRNFANLHAGHGEDGHGHEPPEPVGGRFFTWPLGILLTLTLIGVAVVVWRFLGGLGPTTALNDGYPKGVWLTLNVVVGTAVACGGYSLAILCYLLNRGRYHPLIRSAMLVSALGYSLGGLTVLIDLGRAWNAYKLPFFPYWNFNSILLEIALCVMLYTTVLWLELSPSLFARWRSSPLSGLRRLAVVATPWVERAMPGAIAVGLLLPTMHQSSLGSLMLLAGEKLHPLWQTPLLPLLFLVSCIAMGFAGATLENCLSSRAFGRPAEMGMLRALALPAALTILAYLAIRTVDVAWRGQIEAVVRMDRLSLLFLVEMGLFLAAAVVLLAWRRHAGMLSLTLVAATVLLAGSLYRFSAFLLAFNPGPEWTYFPTLPEIAVSVGIVSGQVMGYILMVKWFPILRGAPRTPRAAQLPVATPAAAEPARALAA
jgi:Ni/Fe-hydrogenase subunit HybB-like protein/Fe-S-cluster-containing dehydrogenase component